MNRILSTLLALALSITGALAGSTINIGVPSASSTLSSAPIRGNFQAAANDINNILGMYAGTSAPSSPTTGQVWRDTNTTPNIVKIWTGSAWTNYLQFNTSGSITPYQGNKLFAWQQIMNGSLGTLNQCLLSTGAGTVPAFGACPAGSSNLTIGTSTITSGTNGYFLYNNSGVLGNVQLVPLASGGTNSALTASNGGIVYSTASSLGILSGTVTAGQCLLSGSNTTPSWGSCLGGAAVSSISAGDGTLTISPTTGSAVATLNLSNANTWLANQTFPNSGILLKGSSSGITTFASANAGASNYTITYPAATGTVALTSGVVSSIAGNVGAFTVSTGITNSTNDIRLVVPVTAANGGTGVVSPTAKTLPINQGASAQTNTGVGTLGQCLASDGGTLGPVWTSGCGTVLATQTGNQAAYTFTNIGTYRRYIFNLVSILPVTNDTKLLCEVSDDNGSTWKTTSYIGASVYVDSGGSVGSITSTTDVALSNGPGGTIGVNNGAGKGWTGTVIWDNPSSTSNNKVVTVVGGSFFRGAGSITHSGINGGYYYTGSTAALTAFRCRYNSGNIASGTMTMIGYL